MTNDADLAARLDAIAFPGLTANFDVGSTAALAVTLLDWKVHGPAYAAQMVATAQRLAAALADRGVPVFAADRGATASHAFAVDADRYGGGDTSARTLRRANVLASAIGLPHDAAAGLRLGTNEITRWGATPDDSEELAALIARALAGDPDGVAREASAWRRRLTRLSFVR